MNTGRTARWLVFFVGFVLLATGCSGDDDQTDTPGDGVAVEMARADWDTGWFQAEVYANLLRRLGYEVADPVVTAQDAFYEGAARGELDFWANGWFPNAEPRLDEEIDGLGRVGDFVQPVGLQVDDGALQGILIDSATAWGEDVATLGELVADPDLVELFDTDGNGRAEILGCQDDWGCAVLIDEIIEEAGPEVLEQVRGDYREHVDTALGRIERGEPVLLYTWTPTDTVELLPPGRDVLWLDTSPAGASDRLVELSGSCTTATCRLGFPANDIRVVANSQFLDANPAAAALLAEVKIPLDDIQEQNLAMLSGDNTPADVKKHVERWLGQRRALVLDWLREARRAAGAE